jgi:serine/threonine protein kinase
MLSTNGQVKVIDFGLAATYANPCKREVVTGSLGFIAPEVLNNLDYDNRVDLFSIGAIAFSLLYNEAPFIKQRFEETLKRNKACILEFPND